MRIDPEQPIFGVRPAKLKKLLGREYFSTIDAMRDLQAREPHVSELLRNLAADGWIKFGGTDSDGIERWETDDIGRRLMATRLIKRFPIKDGLALLPKIVAKAEALNAETGSSRRIESIWLFGSVLTGKPEDTAGDIDLVVNLSRRPLPEAELKALEVVEMSRAPERARMGWFRDFRNTELLRQIKKVSHRISIHDPSDIEIFGLPYREIYRFDLDTDRTGVPRGDGIGEGIDGDDGRRDQAQIAPPITFSAWPHAPNETVTMEDPADFESLLIAQHLYVRGLEASEIAKLVRLSEDGVKAYLSKIPEQPQWEQTDPATRLQDYLRRADPNMGIYIEADAPRYGKQRIMFSLLAPETIERRSRCHRFAKNDAYFWGDPTHFAYLDAVTEAAWGYVEKVFGTAPKIERSLTKFRSETETEQAYVPPVQNLSALRPLLIQLAEQIKRKSPDWDESDAIRIDFAAHRPITHVHGSRYFGDYRETKLRKDQAPALWDAIMSLRDADDGLFNAGFHLVLSAGLEEAARREILGAH